MGESRNTITPTSGMNPWRAGCSESCTSGSEGGPEKPTSRKADRALRPDPYTYVKTHAGWVYAAFIIDVYTHLVVGWQISNRLRSDLAIDALEMAIWNRTRTGQVLDRLVHHSDRGVQYLSVRYSERLAQNDIVASVGSRGDSYDKGIVSYCTSWCWLGGNSTFEPAALAFDEAGIARDGRVEEPGVAVVGPVAGEQAGTMPGLDGRGAHAELLGDLGDGEFAGGAQPVGRLGS